MGAAWPRSLPTLLTLTPTITWVAVSVANWPLKAGRKPPSAIFMTRQSGAVVETRPFPRLLLGPRPPAPGPAPSAPAGVSPRPLGGAPPPAFATSPQDPRVPLPARPPPEPPHPPGAVRADPLEGNEAAPALARTRTPSWATRLRSTSPSDRSVATLAVNRSSSHSPCATRNSASVWWFTDLPASMSSTPAPRVHEPATLGVTYDSVCLCALCASVASLPWGGRRIHSGAQGRRWTRPLPSRQAHSAWATLSNAISSHGISSQVNSRASSVSCPAPKRGSRSVAR